MLKDSKTMKAIAIVTMFFLPATSVAAICGSQFFGLDTSQSPPEILVAGRIWIFCIVAVVMTVVVLGSWWMLTESTFALQNERKKIRNNWLLRRQKQRKQNVC
jgi:Mg2+ and Co2+ transporter CorA